MLFRKKGKVEGYSRERYERLRREGYNPDDDVENINRGLIKKGVIIFGLFLLLGSLGIFLLNKYINSRPNPYELAVSSVDSKKAEKSPEDTTETAKTEKNKIDKLLSDYEMYKKDSLTKDVNNYRKELTRIVLEPMVDGTSSEFRQEFKELPIESVYSDEIFMDLKEENIGAYDKENLVKGIYDIDANDLDQYKILVGPQWELPSDEEIKRLKSYECYKLTYDGKLSANYKSFEAKYKNDRNNAEYVYNSFHPASVYANAQITWKSSPKLIYDTPLNQAAIRGVIIFRYYDDKKAKYGLKMLKKYERDVEFRLKFTTDGKFLNKAIYLSDWREANE